MADPTTKPIGLVQTPQSFYNADLFQFNFYAEKALPNEQDFFSRCVNTINNAHGSAIYTGSNTLILRKAIEDAGGFPINTITEDFELGARINGKGYTSFSTDKPMASGLTPTDVPSMLKQRIRWARGVIQSARNLRLFTTKDLPLNRKLVFLNGYFYWWSFFRRLIFIFAPILFSLFGIRVVNTDTWSALLLWLPAFVMIRLIMGRLSSDFRTQRLAEVQETIFAPYLVLPVLLETLGIRQTKFKVTNKAAKQAKSDLLYGIPHMIIMALIVYGLIKFNLGKFGSELFSGIIITFWLLAHLLNVLLAVMFFMGRPSLRKTERFLARYPITVKYGKHMWITRTEDISEEGLSFSLLHPVYFPPDAVLHFHIHRGDYSACLEGQIMRVISSEGKWTYAVKLRTMDRKDYLQYLSIIYDGFNQNLPQIRDKWLTIGDVLMSFYSAITSRVRAKGDGRSLKPVLCPDDPVYFNGHPARIIRFDFETITLRGALGALPERGTLVSHGVRFDLTRHAIHNGDEYVFNIINHLSLSNTPELYQLVSFWQCWEGESRDSAAVAY